MQTVNKADENFKKLAVMFPNAVTETIDENGEVLVLLIKMCLSRKFLVRLLTEMRSAINLLGLTRRSRFFLPIHR